ncbi:hypothetical protein OSTOST_20078 [Ostertagia ostertagi]
MLLVDQISNAAWSRTDGIALGSASTINKSDVQLIVFVAIMLHKLGRDSVWSSESSTGVLMLFSAGTFLFVATVHVLPELANRAKSQKDYMLVVDAQSPATAGHSHSGGTSFTIKELVAIIGGAIVPALLSSGHSHSS